MCEALTKDVGVVISHILLDKSTLLTFTRVRTCDLMLVLILCEVLIANLS